MPVTKDPPPVPLSDLHQPLPPDLVPSMTWWPFGYRQYPVFSLPWLKRRTILTTVLIVMYGTLSGLANHSETVTWSDVLGMLGYFVSGFVVMFSGGPALATWVRHRQFSPRAEAAGILAAVLVGFVLAMVADFWASQGISRSLGHPELPPNSEPGENPLGKARLTLFMVGSIFFHFAISGSVACWAYFSERRRRTARAMHLAALDSDMQLAVLQAQIEPHFLFNTLATIRPLIRQDAARAESALDALADHLRATIPQMREGRGRIMSTLGQQLDICASYLGVMHVRMDPRLHHRIDVPEDLREMPFPPLMLLSLVENAIKHGLEPKPGPGTISIRASLTGSDLTVSVSDDGQGLKDGLSSGLGLANIREQLHVRYGGRARLKVAARPEGGTVAAIMIPTDT